MNFRHCKCLSNLPRELPSCGVPPARDKGQETVSVTSPPPPPGGVLGTPLSVHSTAAGATGFPPTPGGAVSSHLRGLAAAQVPSVVCVPLPAGAQARPLVEQTDLLGSHRGVSFLDNASSRHQPRHTGVPCITRGSHRQAPPLGSHITGLGTQMRLLPTESRDFRWT